jgi:hypothetical protein
VVAETGEQGLHPDVAIGHEFRRREPVVLTVPGRKSGRERSTPVTGVGFMKRTGLVADGMPDVFEALAGRCAVFRLDPV